MNRSPEIRFTYTCESDVNIMLKVILAVSNFFFGDLVILLGVTLIMVTLALIDSLDALAPLR